MLQIRYFQANELTYFPSDSVLFPSPIQPLFPGSFNVMLRSRRLHLETAAGNVSTVMVPVRPTAMTAGSVSLKPDELLQIV